MAPKKKKARKTKGRRPAKKSVKRSSRRKRNLGKIQVAKKNILERLERVNRVINRFEGDVEGLIKKIVKQGERSRKEIRKNFDDILSKIGAGGIFARANETREDLEREVKRLAEEVMNTVKEVESKLHQERLSGLFQNARKNLNNVLELLSENGLVVQAKATVDNTRKEIFGLFSIPTQDEVEKLERKIVNLERRLSNLSRKAA